MDSSALPTAWLSPIPELLTERLRLRAPISGDAAALLGVRARLAAASERRVCRVLGVSRTAVRQRRTERTSAPPRLDPALTTRLEALIQRYPTFGYRRLWAWLRFREGYRITPKTVYRILALKGWFVHQRPVTPRPRVQAGTGGAARGVLSPSSPALESSGGPPTVARRSRNLPTR